MIIIEKDLSEAFDRLRLMDMRRAMGQAIKTVQAYAKNLCPVHDGELRDSIYTSIDAGRDHVRGECYTNKEYAVYVEFGTGPKGAASHEGISPNVNPSYTMSPWWIHESQVDRGTAETYGWFHIDTPEGRFYQCTGQAAQPFMYPALKDSEDEIDRIFAKAVKR